MNIQLKRSEGEKTDKSSISKLFIDDKEECFILEDVDRGLNSNMPLAEINKKKVYGQTAIPYGRYKIVVTKSARFSKMKGVDVYLPLLLNVPGYEGVRIHSGNKPEHTEGCLLPGNKTSKDFVSNSATAFILLNQKINEAIKKGEEVFIDII